MVAPARAFVLVLAGFAGCGRIAFDPLSDGGGGVPPLIDAPPGAAPPECLLDPPQPTQETCSDGIDSNCNGEDEGAPLDDGPLYSQSHAFGLGSLVIGFTDLTCAANDVDTCGTTGGADTFVQMGALQNVTARLRVSSPGVTIALFEGLCTDVRSSSPALACAATCPSTGAREVIINARRDEYFCAVIEQSDPLATSLFVHWTLDGGACP